MDETASQSAAVVEHDGEHVHMWFPRIDANSYGARRVAEILEGVGDAYADTALDYAESDASGIAIGFRYSE